MKKILLLVFFAVFSFNLTAQQKNLHHNPWELIIYRPENSPSMNEVRCYLRLLDEQGNDVTFSAAKATYEWASIPNVVNQYQKTSWLSGGVAMHLNLKPGKYKISVYTPPFDNIHNPRSEEVIENAFVKVLTLNENSQNCNYQLQEELFK